MSKFILNKQFDTVGNGTGTKNAIGNYSAEAQSFKITVPANKTYSLENLKIYMASSSAFTTSGYGSSLANITNGWTIKVRKDGVLTDILDGMVIKSNYDLEGIATSINRVSFSGLEDGFVVTVSFSEYGIPFYLKAAEYIEIVLNDDFSGLTKHQFIIKGHGENL